MTRTRAGFRGGGRGLDRTWTSWTVASAVLVSGLLLFLRNDGEGRGPEHTIPLAQPVVAPREAILARPESIGAASRQDPPLEEERGPGLDLSSAAELEAVVRTEADAEMDWGRKYADASLGQLVDAQRALMAALAQETGAYYEREFQAGRYEVSFPIPDEKLGYAVPAVPGELSTTRFLPSGEMRTVRLPREGFEQAYTIERELRWVNSRKEELERERPGGRGSKLAGG